MARGHLALAIACLAVGGLPTVLGQQLPLAAESKSGSSWSGAADSRSGAKNPFTDEFGTFAEGVMDEWKLAGMSIAVVDGDDVYAKGYGYAVLPDTKAKPDTLWYVGSTTKAQLAASLAHLIDTKEYDALENGWSTPISSLIRDDFVLQNEWSTNHLTLEDAVSHRTGMGSHDMAMARKVNDTENPIKTIVRNLRNLPVSKEPRVASHYCNPMFGVLTHVVETLTGGRLGNLLKKVLWEPLGMDSTYLYLDDAKKSGHDLSRGYWWSEKNESFVAMALFPTDEVSGAGAAISTVLDYAKWIKALLRKDGVLSEAVHDDIRKPRFIFNQYPAPGVDVTLYSLGWFRTVFHGELAYWHSGSTVTHGTLVYWLPERDYGVAMMTNAANEVRDVIMYRLLEERLGVPEEKRVKMNEIKRTQAKAAKEQVANAVDLVFPNRPSKPLPPTRKVSELVGKYSHAGYGVLQLEEASSAFSADYVNDQPVLIADRPAFIFAHKFKLEHVSGDYWLVRLLESDLGDAVTASFKGEFKMRPDGGVKGLEVTMAEVGDDFVEGVIFFERQ